MECLRCQKENPDGQPYCGNCGLHIPDSGTREYVGQYVDNAIEKAIKNKIMDREVVEVQVMENCVARLRKWSRWLLAVLIPTIVVLMAVIGYDQYRIFVGTNQFRNSIIEANLELKSNTQEFKDRLVLFSNEAGEARSTMPVGNAVPPKMT